MTRLWIVRAGKQGDRELAAIEQGRLLPGFLEVGDLRRFSDRNAILEHLAQVMPDGGGGTGSGTSQRSSISSPTRYRSATSL